MPCPNAARLRVALLTVVRCDNLADFAVTNWKLTQGGTAVFPA